VSTVRSFQPALVAAQEFMIYARFSLLLIILVADDRAVPVALVLSSKELTLIDNGWRTLD
jgi:hypothetical protein